MKKNKHKIILLIIIGILIVLLSSFSFAYYIKKDIEGNLDNTMVLTTIDYGQITVSYENGNNTFSASSVDLPQSEEGTNKNYIIKFQIESTSEISNNIAIRWINLTNTFCKYADKDEQTCTNDPTDTYVADELTYQLYSCTSTQYNNVTNADDEDISSCTKISNTTDQAVPVTGSTSRLHSDAYITVDPSTTTYYIVKVILKNLEEPQRYNMNKSFNGSIKVDFYIPSLVDKILEMNTPVADNASSTYVSSGSGIDFASISSPTNGQGLYINSKSNIASDSTQGTIKYFRGGTYCAYTDYLSEDTSGTKCIAAGGTWDSTTYHCSLHDSKATCESKSFTYYELKNNVMFAGFAWRIIRINADGSIRMIYNGTSSTARGTNAQTGTSAFNTTINNNKYVGYMYGASTSSYDTTHANTNNSTIKSAVDTWYVNNLSSYSSNFIDSGFCGDRSLYSGLGYGTNTTYYGPYDRENINKTPTFSCPLTNDLYTLTTSIIGNKALMYSIGLISIDEASYAGGVYNTNNFIYYLQSGSAFWNIGPISFVSSNAKIIVNAAYGNIYVNNASASYGIRPVINLNPDLIISSGTGTLTDPWVIAS